MEVFGPNAPINTPDLTYDRANYTAYFDNYSLESVPLTPDEVAIQFAVTDYAAGETAGAARVNIIRRGYLDSAVSAAFSTSDGSAAAGRDYLPVSTLIAFAPGEREKDVLIPILDDALIEADEIVHLSLAAVTPNVQLPRPSAPLWILDNERPGSVDPAFRLDTESAGLTTVYEIPSIALVPGGKLVATLFGLDANGNYAGLMARFNSDGSMDPGFETYPVPYGTGPSQVTPVFGGQALIVNLGERLARFHPNGREDTHFKVNVTDPDFAYISDVLVQPDQKIIIAGYFSGVNGVPRRNIARLLVTGAVDKHFDPGAGTDDLIIDAALQSDGRILIGGYFQHVAGQPRPLLARLMKDGSPDSSFDTGEGFGDSVYGFPYIQSLAVQPDGRILAGGSFDSYQGAPRTSLARLMPGGAIDVEFAIGDGFVSGFYPGPGYISGLALQPDGKALVSGGFGSFDGDWATGIVRLNANGSLDTAFQLGGSESFAAPLSGGPAMTLLPDGDVLVFLYSNVSFIKNEPVTYQGIVRLNGDPSRPKQYCGTWSCVMTESWRKGLHDSVLHPQ
jgi:uncharacterized delta-60 repeat protein